MKKIILLFLVLSSIVIFAQDYEIAPQRMNTDYNGIAYNEDIILCYGNHGIMTFTTDKGKKWGTVFIGDKHNIQNILHINNNFIAVSEFSAFLSDDGIHWNENQLSQYPDVIDIAYANDKFYLLMNNGIYEADLNFNLKKMLTLNHSDNYKEIQTDSTYLYVLANNTTDSLEKAQLLRYDLFNSEHTVLDLPKSQNHFIRRSYSELNIIKNKILFAVRDIDFKKRFLANYTDIFISEDTGNSWYNLSYYTRIFDAYSSDEDMIYFLKRSRINDNPYLKIKYPKLTTFDSVTDSEIEITDMEKSVNEHIYDSKFLYFTDFVIIGDVVIAVGTDMTIFMSDDGGESFDIVSNYNNIYSYNHSQRNKSPVIYNENSINVYYRGTIFNTTNSGITWKPEKENIHDFDYHQSLSDPMLYYNAKNGKVIYLYDSLTIKSDNYGIEFEKFKATNISYNSQTHFSDYSGIKCNNNILFGKYYDYYQVSPYSKVFIFDETGIIKDSVIIDSVLIKQIFRNSNGKLFALGMKKKMADTNYVSEPDTAYLRIDYHILVSEDCGYNWDILDIEIPLKPTIKYQSWEKIAHIDDYNALYKYKKWILMPNTAENSKLLYCLNMETLQFNKIELPAELNRTNIYNSMFEHKDRLYFVSSNSDFYYTEDLFAEDIIWEKIDLKDYLYDWKPTNAPYDTVNAVYSAWANEEQILFTIIKRNSELGSSYVNARLTFCKMYGKDIATSVVELPHTETQNYLYTYPPYPQPASTEVSSLVYWDTSLEMNKESVRIYNTNGVEVSREQDITFEQINAYSGNLTWNCNNVPDGVYLIQISHGDKKQTIKVMVRK